MANLPETVEKDEARLAVLQADMADNLFYQKSESYQAEQYEKVQLLQASIESNMNRWEEVEAQIGNLPSIN